MNFLCEMENYKKPWDQSNELPFGRLLISEVEGENCFFLSGIT
jgi:hypothetical protein